MAYSPRIEHCPLSIGAEDPAEVWHAKASATYSPLDEQANQLFANWAPIDNNIATRIIWGEMGIPPTTPNLPLIGVILSIQPNHTPSDTVTEVIDGLAALRGDSWSAANSDYNDYTMLIYIFDQDEDSLIFLADVKSLSFVAAAGRFSFMLEEQELATPASV